MCLDLKGEPGAGSPWNQTYEGYKTIIPKSIIQTYFCNKIIVVTSLDISKTMTSRHSSGKKLYEFADVVLDNRGVEGDAIIELEGLDTKVCGTSSITAAMLLNATILEAIQIMLDKGYVPPVYMSANVDGGPEFNKKLVDEYAYRLRRI